MSCCTRERSRSRGVAPGWVARSGPFASDTPAPVWFATMFMCIFEYSYDSTALLNPKRSVYDW